MRLSDIDASTSTDAHPSNAPRLETLNDVLVEKERLTSSKSIDKSDAIAIERIVHALERIVMRNTHEADRRLDELQRRVDTLELEKRHAILMEQTQGENAHLKDLLAQAQQQCASVAKRR